MIRLTISSMKFFVLVWYCQDIYAIPLDYDRPKGPLSLFTHPNRLLHLADQLSDGTSLESHEMPKEDDKYYFMDAYTLQTGPKQIEFGHVAEDPYVWEQRYEKKDHDKNRFQGQAKWGDKYGGYGEQYWDLNHGGNTKDSEDDPAVDLKDVDEMEEDGTAFTNQKLYKKSNRVHQKKPRESVEKNNRKIFRKMDKRPKYSKLDANRLVYNPHTGIVKNVNNGEEYYVVHSLSP